MRVYFLSDRTCALKVGGIYLGLIDGFERFIDIIPKDNVLCELLPVDGRFLPIHFLFNENIFDCPPAFVSVYRLPDSIAIYADNFPFTDSTLHILCEQTTSNGKVTLFTQGKVQLGIFNGTKSVTCPLSDDFLTAKIKQESGGILVYTEKSLCIFSWNGTLLLSTDYLTYNFEKNYLQATVPFHDSLGHTALCQWEWQNNHFQLTQCKMNKERECDKNFLLFSFFESLLIGANISDMVTKEFLTKIEDVKEFLGKYQSAVYTQSIEKGAGLCYYESKNVYRVEYYIAEYKEEKIDNILKL